jgi:protein-tyrosine phosphatase
MKTPKGRNDKHVFDYSKITKHIIVGSDFCLGRHCKMHKDEFEKLNVKVEINLAAEKKEKPPDDVSSYSWIPVVDGYAPTKEQFAVGTAIINGAVENRKNVYIHCKNGHGRSPTLVVAYLVKYKNKTISDAIELVKKKRPEIHIEKVQRSALIRFRHD